MIDDKMAKMAINTIAAYCVLHDDVYYCIGDYGPVQRICKDEFIDRLNDAIGNCFNNKTILLEHEKEIKMRKEKILEIIADYMKKE